MLSRDFVYWLQGYFEILEANPNAPKGLTDAQVQTIRNHLNLVFKHEIDPSIDGGNKGLKDALDAIHAGKKPAPTYCAPKAPEFPPIRTETEGGDYLIRC